MEALFSSIQTIKIPYPFPLPLRASVALCEILFN